MIQKVRNTGFRLTCSICHTQDFIPFHDWTFFSAEAKTRGWRFKKIGEQWKHWCRRCVADWAAKKNGELHRQPIQHGHPCPDCGLETHGQGVPMNDSYAQKTVTYHPDCFFRWWK